MRTVIAIAVGIFLGRQLYLMFDREQVRKTVKQKVLALLMANGLTKENAEKQVKEMMDYR